MASHTPARSVHATLTGGAADTVTFTGGGPYKTVLVTNRSASDVIYFRLDGTAPVAAANENYVVAASTAKRVTVDGLVNAPISVVKLISAGNAAFSVEGY